MSALRERVVESRSYEGTTDDKLRQFINEFDTIIQEEPCWPVKAADIKRLISSYHTKYHNQLAYNQLLYDWILQNNIISFKRSAPEKKLEYWADQDQMRVLAAMHFIYPQHAQDLNGRIRKTLNHTREALGSDHLARLLNDPSPLAKIIKPRSPKKTEEWEWKDEDDEIERIEASVDQKTPLRPSDIIPNFDTDQLAELKTWDIPKIEQGLEKLNEIIESGPSYEEHSTAQTGITSCVVNSVIFIHAVNQAALDHKELFAYFDIQRTPTNLELFRDLNVCLAYLQEYGPKINNLGQLFLALKRYIKHNESPYQTPQIPKP